MTIYILDNDPTKTAQALDDKSLDRMIKDIAQVLCNVHRYLEFEDHYMTVTSIPLKPTNWDNKWSQWARQSVANYKYLVELGIALCDEHAFRFYEKDKTHPIIKYENVIAWARDNMPDLPEFIIKDKGKENSFGEKFEYKSYNEQSKFPLVMPKKHLKIYPYKMVHIVESYRNYYQANLEKRIEKEKLYIDESNVGLEQDHHILRLWTRRPKPDWLAL